MISYEKMLKWGFHHSLNNGPSITFTAVGEGCEVEIRYMSTPAFSACMLLPWSSITRLSKALEEMALQDMAKE